MTKSSLIYKLLKKCEAPPNAGFFWCYLNFLFNVFLALVGKIVIRTTLTDFEKGRNYAIMVSKNMGDLLFMIRGLKDLNRINGFEESVLVAGTVFKKPLMALGIKDCLIVDYWKIIAIDKALQLSPEKYRNVVIGGAYMFFGTKAKDAVTARFSLPHHMTEETKAAIFTSACMEGRTVVLSPYEQSITVYRDRHLELLFWERLADNLKKEGFYVMTNCNGKREKPIYGTVQFFPPLDEVSAAVEHAGYCVAITSGFTDWISNAELKKEIVLYPTRRSYEFYNLDIKWNKTNVIELIYDQINMEPADMADWITALLME